MTALGFAPTDDAVQVRLAAASPQAYARSRNHLDGAVTRLSPYLTHGFLTLRDVATALTARHRLTAQHKLVFELGWRDYFQHVWAHRGEGIFSALHPGPMPEDAYGDVLPVDVRQARTGVPVVDQAVRALYAQGWLHNHARMWLASYLVHGRHVHWRVGADWLYGHLLDGDLASNHLSWQWVAGTGSAKPYLFNADNVARYAPPSWHSPGSVIDVSYEALDRQCRDPDWAPSAAACATASLPQVPGVTEPAVLHEPPCGSRAPLASPAQPGGAPGFTSPDARLVAGCDVWLVHPWALRPPPPSWPSGGVRIGVCERGFHRRWGWSAQRWHFVTTRMRELCDHLWWADAGELRTALAQARSVRSIANLHLAGALDGVVAWDASARLFVEPGRRCHSFSQWWRCVTADAGDLDALLERSAPAQA